MSHDQTGSTPIVKEVLIKASVEKVWNAITDKEQMKEWYFTLEEFKPEVGFEFQFYGQGKEGENYLHLCTVTEVIPFKKLQHSWRYDGYEGNSFVCFELFDENGFTRLRLTHEGLETFPPIAAFAKENFNEGWTYIIEKSLKEFAEH